MSTPAAPVAGFMRAGALLVAANRAVLPDRCVKCNEPSVCRRKVKLRWHASTLYFLLILMCVIGVFGLLLYAIAAVIVSKRVTLNVGLCTRHRRSRIRNLTTATLITLSSVPLLLLSLELSHDVAIWTLVSALLAFVGGIIYLAVAGPILTPTKIVGGYAYAKGCSPAFLATLTPAPRCNGCGYDLRGHDIGDEVLRCPECGLPVYGPLEAM